MQNYKISLQLTDALIELDNFYTQDHYHLDFDLNVKTKNLKLNYPKFTRAGFAILDFTQKRTNKLIDENQTKNFVELGKNYLKINFNLPFGTILTTFNLHASEWAKIDDFLIELEAFCKYFLKI